MGAILLISIFVFINFSGPIRDYLYSVVHLLAGAIRTATVSFINAEFVRTASVRWYKIYAINLVLFYEKMLSIHTACRTNKDFRYSYGNHINIQYPCWPWLFQTYKFGNFAGGGLRAQDWCWRLKVAPGRGLSVFSFRHFCCKMYHLVTMHSFTDRRTALSVQLAKNWLIVCFICLVWPKKNNNKEIKNMCITIVCCLIRTDWVAEVIVIGSGKLKLITSSCCCCSSHVWLSNSIFSCITTLQLKLATKFPHLHDGGCCSTGYS